MTNSYKTIIAKTEGLYKDKGSKFLSFAIPVTSTEEIKDIIKDFRKEFYDARHVCYAYVLGADRDEWRANDDGEPSGTAGRPILGQINSRELTNILVVVVRYFGGILLGTSGLINAYKEACIEALNVATIIEKTVDSSTTIHFDFILMNDVMRVVKDTNAKILHQDYDSNCIMQLSIQKMDFEMLLSKLEKIIGVVIDTE